MTTTHPRITQLQEDKKKLEKEIADYTSQRGSLNIYIKSNERRIKLIDYEVEQLSKIIGVNDDMAK